MTLMFGIVDAEPPLRSAPATYAGFWCVACSGEADGAVYHAREDVTAADIEAPFFRDSFAH